jgi:hypothetical protein
MKTYRSRHSEGKLKLLARNFKVILVTGARQVGKSTLLKKVFPALKNLVFDPVQDLFRAREDPDFFLDSQPSPLILDEIQYAPELLPALKRRVDLVDKPGQYFLSGFQNLGVLRTVSESLAGRVGILNLSAMTLAEIEGRGASKSWLERFLAAPETFQPVLRGSSTRQKCISVLWRGGFPGLLRKSDKVVPEFFRSYVQTYVERDIRLIEDIRKMGAFSRFLGLLGALSAQEINHSQIGRDVGVSPGTARKWLELLTATFLWFELPSYHGNAIKRLSGKPKGYLADSGLACHFQRVSSPEALGVSRFLGSIFETWAVGAILKQCRTFAVQPTAYHWRTNGGAEVDLVLERDGFLFPIEMKAKTVISGHDVKGIKAFQETYPKITKPGLIVYLGNDIQKIGDSGWVVPWHFAG